MSDHCTQEIQNTAPPTGTGESIKKHLKDMTLSERKAYNNVVTKRSRDKKSKDLLGKLL
jgi:hypothetical protein